MILGPFFHWSPTERRTEIRVGGLKPYSQPTVSDGNLAYPYISLGLTPSEAWQLSGDMGWVSEIEEWDLWEVHLPHRAEVHIRPTWGGKIEEAKVYSVIPPVYIWFTATRSPLYAKEVTILPSELPFKITAQTKGAQKAYQAFLDQYGKEEGTRIFLLKAEEQGKGTTLREKVNSIYKRGATLGGN